MAVLVDVRTKRPARQTIKDTYADAPPDGRATSEVA
jgi:hypothetical protein